RSQDRLQDPAKGLAHPFRQTAFAVRRVGPNHLQAFELATQTFDQTSGAIVTALAAHLGRFHRLAVNDCSTRCLFAPFGDTDLSTQLIVYLLPNVLLPPPSKNAIDRVPVG